MNMADQTTINEGDHVAFKTEDKTRIFQVFRNRTIFFEKNKLKGGELIGQKYGTLFEVQHGKLVASSLATLENSATGSSLVSEGSGKDNRDLVASGENQKLSQEEILKMKEEGLSGQDIIGKLVQQSETFKTKTEFSQEKYIKKKKKKHMLMFRVLQPNSSILLDTFKQNPSKICNLRADTLSQLLCYSNVMSGSTVAVVESCQGLVLGSVMERLGGSGQVLHLYPGNDMNRHIVKDFNFSEDQAKVLHDFPLNKLASLENGTLLATVDPASKSTMSADGSDNTNDTTKLSSLHQKSQKASDSNGAASDSVAALMDVDDKDDASDEGREGGDEDVHGDDSDDGGKSGGAEGKGDGGRKGGGKRKKPKDKNPLTPAQLEAKKQQKYEKLREAASILQERNLDSLIIATKHDPVTLLLRLLPYVGPSRPVVVFSQHKEPLVECFTKVKENSFGVQLRLSESWYREYQVLPSRTHPLNSMSGTGGYLLSFIRVVSHQ